MDLIFLILPPSISGLPAYACITTLPIILRPNVALLTHFLSLSHHHHTHTDILFRRVIDVLRNRFRTIDWYEVL